MHFKGWDPRVVEHVKKLGVDGHGAFLTHRAAVDLSYGAHSRVSFVSYSQLRMLLTLSHLDLLSMRGIPQWNSHNGGSTRKLRYSGLCFFCG